MAIDLTKLHFDVIDAIRAIQIGLWELHDEDDLDVLHKEIEFYRQSAGLLITFLHRTDDEWMKEELGGRH